MKKVTKILLVSMLAFAQLLNFVQTTHAKETKTYEIYPIPQEISYPGEEFILRSGWNVVYEKGIDNETKNRLQEVAALKNMKVVENSQMVSNHQSTNILLGIYNDNDTTVDSMAQKQGLNIDSSLFQKDDSYQLYVNNGNIIILGKDSDAVFYGLTTLYHVVKQLDSMTIQNFNVKDYADVKSRGFIEGYYGNPWTTEDRVKLMEWSGYYKLNTYFYAPKDDDKHRTKWYELYSDQELKDKIIPLATAGNKSKTRFAYALHPFTSIGGNGDGSAFSFNTENGGYNKSFQKLKDKFMQVIAKAGVRQIALLADDFANPGGANGKRIMEDLTKWLKEEVKPLYPDMKTTVPYVPYNYGANSFNHEEFNQLKLTNAEDVQLVMTGGRVWGEVSEDFTRRFKESVGRGPYLWINWPCSDNSKRHLIMGGYSAFLHSGVNPQNIEGIILNPMQQSEPSKVAIFGNACYSWNIWSKEEADKAYEASFKYVEHNSAIETPASNALKELSKHMINQAMDGRVVKLEESIVLKEKLNAFRQKLNDKSVKVEDVEGIRKEFENLQEAAKILKEQSQDRRLVGENTGTSEQMLPWLQCWNETTAAAIAYLNAIEASLIDDVTALLQYNAQGKDMYNKSQSHGFKYVNGIQYAEVGVQHIMPFIRTLSNYVSKKAEMAMNIDTVIENFYSNEQKVPLQGSVELALDGKNSTFVKIKDKIQTNDFVGVVFNKEVTVEKIRFLFGANIDTSKMQIQYRDGVEWKELSISDPKEKATNEILYDKTKLPANLKATGVRVLMKEEQPQPLQVHEIQINKEGVPEYSTNGIRHNNSLDSVLQDGKLGNAKEHEWWIASDGSATNKDTYLQLDLGGEKEITLIDFKQGGSQPNDVIDQGKIQYLDYNSKEWKDINNATVTSAKEQQFNVMDQKISTSSLRVVNTEYKRIWWRIGEFNAHTKDGELIKLASSQTLKIGDHPNINNNAKNNKFEYLFDGDLSTCAWMVSGNNGNLKENDSLLVSFSKPISLGSIKITQDGSDKSTQGTIEYQDLNKEWHNLFDYKNATAIIETNGNHQMAQAMRIINKVNLGNWWKVFEIAIENTNATTHNYTNTVGNTVKTIIEEGSMKMTSGQVSLNTNEYIGFDLGNIKELKNLQYQTSTRTGNVSNVQLQISKNEINWETIKPEEAIGKQARFVRLFNVGPLNNTFTLDKFEVSYVYKKAPSFYDSNIVIDGTWGQSDVRLINNGYQAFDNDLTTRVLLGGYINANDKFAIFDLGQERTIENIRYYVNENEVDFIRDAVFEVANSVNSTSWQPVLTIGDGVEDNASTKSLIAKNYSEYVHDGENPGNMYKEAILDTPITGRYIRVRFHAPFPHRFASIYELRINNGKYVSMESNVDIVSEHKEEPGKIPSYMLDKNYATSYRSSSQNSSFTYTPSQPQGKQKFRVVQTGAISHAVVKAIISDTNGENEEEVVLGKLDQTISEFILKQGKIYKQITVSWEHNIPEILELGVYEYNNLNDDATLVKEELRKLLGDSVDTTLWTTSAKYKLQEANAQANTVLASKYASKFVVESSISAIKNAKAFGSSEAGLKYQDNTLDVLLKDRISNDKKYYTMQSYQIYESAYQSAEKVNNEEARKDLSIAKAKPIVANLQKAKDGLIFSTMQKELAILELENETIQSIEAQNYTKQSFTNYETAKKALEQAVASDHTKPWEYEDKVKGLKENKANLVNVEELKVLINEFTHVDEKLYSKDSYANYQQAIKEAKQLLNDGSKDQVQAMIKKVQMVKQNLVPIKTVLEKVIADAKALNPQDYTKQSYQNLSNALQKAQQAIQDNKQDEFDAHAQAITKAKGELVNIIALKKQIEKAKQVQPDQFTNTSYQTLVNALESAIKAMENGTQEEVNKVFDQLQQAMHQLVVSGNKKLEAYVKSIVLVSSKNYTNESYARYKNAYDNMKNAMQKDVSMEQFVQLKNQFEEAKQALQLLKADYTKLEAVKQKIPADLSHFNSKLVARLNQILENIDYNKTILEQNDVDEYTKQLNEVLQNLLEASNDGNIHMNTPNTSDQTTVALWIFLVILSSSFMVYFKVQNNKKNKKM